MALTGQPRPGRGGYARGLWDSPDLVALVGSAARNAAGLDRLRRARSPRSASRSSASARTFDRSTRNRRRRDIAAHYDLGNELFLADARPDHELLVRGVRRRTRRRSRRRRSRSSSSSARSSSSGARTTCSRSGPAGARSRSTPRRRAAAASRRRRSRASSTTTRVAAVRPGRAATIASTVLLEDYRDLTGHYDKLVSIEMIEAVGWRHIGVFFAKCSELLARTGRCCSRRSRSTTAAYEVEKASRSFINTHIFPGGCLPSLEVITRKVARRTDMQMGTSRISPLTTSRRSGAGRRTSPPGPANSPRSATTSGSGACGRCISPTARPGSRSGGSSTFSSRSRNRAAIPPGRVDWRGSVSRTSLAVCRSSCGCRELVRHGERCGPGSSGSGRLIWRRSGRR